MKGRADMKKKWRAAEVEYAASMLAIQSEIRNREFEYQDRTLILVKEIEAQAKKRHEEVTRIERDYSDRLRQSDQRAEIYKRNAQAGQEQCSHLAEYAGRLDRSIESGRQVVERLRATLKLRDEHIEALHQHLRNLDLLLEN